MTMLNNKRIAKFFKEMAEISELLDENRFKVKSYNHAYQAIRSSSVMISSLNLEQMENLTGVGKRTASKIIEILDTGSLSELEEKIELIPSGVLEMLKLKGIGAKKIRTLWQDHNITSLEILKEAAEHNDLIRIKGIAKKTQDKLLAQAEFLMESRNKWNLKDALAFYQAFQAWADDNEFQVIPLGQLRRKDAIISSLELATSHTNPLEDLKLLDHFQISRDASGNCRIQNKLPLKIFELKESSDKWIFQHSRPLEGKAIWDALYDEHKSELTLFSALGYPRVLPELYSRLDIPLKSERKEFILNETDIKGLIHCHSTYSDGTHTLQQMAEAAASNGLEYMLITDHSKSAFYAGGLTEDDIKMQWDEIDELNQKLTDFKIFKGIESDILRDGRLDYEYDILEKFDVVIASIHSQLDMSENQATERLLKAIENPYTDVLGHLTGRILLSREAYPVDHEKVIRACAEHQVAIEINCNPHRMDIDWKWLGLCRELDVAIVVSPDAHSIEEIEYIRYGVIACIKGLLTQENCLNVLDSSSFIKRIKDRRKYRLDIVNNI